MRAVLVFSTVVLLVLLASPPPLTIHVNPVTLFGGQSLRITCRVAPREANRAITLAIEGYRYSTQMIDGENGPVTFTLQADHVPCEAEEAACTLETATHQLRRVTMPLTVVC